MDPPPGAPAEKEVPFDGMREALLTASKDPEEFRGPFVRLSRTLKRAIYRQLGSLLKVCHHPLSAVRQCFHLFAPLTLRQTRTSFGSYHTIHRCFEKLGRMYTAK